MKTVGCRSEKERNKAEGWMGRKGHFGVREKPDVRKISRNPQGRPQLRLLTMEDRVPELAIYCNQIGDYASCHQRAVIQQLMEADGEIHSLKICLNLIVHAFFVQAHGRQKLPPSEWRLRRNRWGLRVG